MTDQTKQSGMVSILTIIFFMIFISIIVVSFVRIMSDEQRQTIDNDLSASALAAAQSGIEDGKRVLLHCLNTGAPDAQCATMLNSAAQPNPCSVFKNANSIRGPLNLANSQWNGDYVIVGGNSAEDYQQYYTCLMITKTPRRYTKHSQRVRVPSPSLIPWERWGG